MNIDAKFHSNPSTKYRDIASHVMSINGQRPDGKHDALCLLLLAEAWKWRWGIRQIWTPWAVAQKISERTLQFSNIC